MLQTIQEVQDRVTLIKALIHNNFEPSHLQDKEFVSALGKAVGDIYVKMNEGMCEEIEACKSCSQNRDKIRDLVDLLESIDAGDPVTEEMASQFREFRNELDEMQQRLAAVMTELR